MKRTTKRPTAKTDKPIRAEQRPEIKQIPQ